MRLVGLSGVGKTRLCEALFDAEIGKDSLDPSLAIYTNVAEGPNPPPVGFASDLIAGRTRAILVIDNCPIELHRQLRDVARAANSTISVIIAPIGGESRSWRPRRAILSMQLSEAARRPSASQRCARLANCSSLVPICMRWTGSLGALPGAARGATSAAPSSRRPGRESGEAKTDGCEAGGIAERALGAGRHPSCPDAPMPISGLRRRGMGRRHGQAAWAGGMGRSTWGKPSLAILRHAPRAGRYRGKEARTALSCGLRESSHICAKPAMFRKHQKSLRNAMRRKSARQEKQGPCFCAQEMRSAAAQYSRVFGPVVFQLTCPTM